MVKKNAGKGKDKGKKRVKKQAKKEGPKKPLSGFMFFSSDRRKTLKDERPELKITEASVVIGAEWKKLTDSEKEPYLDRAKEDKERYSRERKMADSAKEAKKKVEDEEEEEKDEDDDDDDDD